MGRASCSSSDDDELSEELEAGEEGSSGLSGVVSLRSGRSGRPPDLLVGRPPLASGCRGLESKRDCVTVDVLVVLIKGGAAAHKLALSALRVLATHTSDTWRARSAPLAWHWAVPRPDRQRRRRPTATAAQPLHRISSS